MILNHYNTMVNLIQMIYYHAVLQQRDYQANVHHFRMSITSGKKKKLFFSKRYQNSFKNSFYFSQRRERILWNYVKDFISD